MNNYYQYLYPYPNLYPNRAFKFKKYTYRYSARWMRATNKKIGALGMSFSYPEKTNRIRGIVDAVMRKIDAVPGFSFIMTPAVYVWTIIMLFFFGIRKSNTACLALLILPLTILLMCMLSPCNGFYVRYLYPIIVIIPFLFPALAHFLARDSARVSEVKAVSLAE